MQNKAFFICASFAAVTLSCKTSSGSRLKDQDLPEKSEASFDVYKNLDEALGEKLAPNELALTKTISGTIHGAIQSAYDKGATDANGKHVLMRDAHPKAHGCVKAEVKVRSDIPPELRFGVFADSDKEYKAWIRYSNANAAVRSDNGKDARGMAIKLTRVGGSKLDPELPEQSTQDFVMINNPTFFVDDPATYLDFFIKGPAALPPSGRVVAGAMIARTAKNPLKEIYWSEVPYRLGVGAPARATKFAAIPRSCYSMSLPSDLADQQREFAKVREANAIADLNSPEFQDGRYLRAAMVKTLASEDVCFTLAVQSFVDPQKTPVEDSSVNWDLNARFTEVADIRIPRQAFTAEAQDTFCENLSFSPWHARVEHKPLGTTNRIRFTVYKAISEFRRTGNKAPVESFQGPTGEEQF